MMTPQQKSDNLNAQVEDFLKLCDEVDNLLERGENEKNGE